MAAHGYFARAAKAVAEANKSAEKSLADERLAAEAKLAEANKTLEAAKADAAAKVAEANKVAEAAKAKADELKYSEFNARYALLESKRRSKAITEDAYKAALADLRKELGL